MRWNMGRMIATALTACTAVHCGNFVVADQPSGQADAGDQDPDARAASSSSGGVDPADAGSSSGGSGSSGGNDDAAASSSSGGAPVEPPPDQISIEWLDAHNTARAQVDTGASAPLPPVVWGHAAHAGLQTWIAECNYQDDFAPTDMAGLRRGASSSPQTPSAVVQEMMTEGRSAYDYASNTCTGQPLYCASYRNIVHRHTERVTCASASCPAGLATRPDGLPANMTWFFWACAYGPAVDAEGRPY